MSKRCTDCPLHKTARCNNIRGEGDPHALVALVGQAPGATEDEKGRVFVGDAGDVLVRQLGSVGVQREDVWLTNVCGCRPPSNRDPTADEMHACFEHLVDELVKVKPRVIVALGNTAADALVGRTGIKALRGKKIWSDRFAAYILVTYHPAALLHQRARADWEVALREDLQRAFELAEELDGTPREKGKVEGGKYVVVDTLKDAKKWAKRLSQAPIVSFDIETTGLNPWASDARVRSIAFCGKEGQAVCFPLYDTSPNELLPGHWSPADLPRVVLLVKRLLEKSSLRKIAHNASFELKYLRKVMGIKVRGLFFDTMLAHYLLNETASHRLANIAEEYTPDLAGYAEESDKFGGVQNAPDLITYRKNCFDVDVTLRVYRMFRPQMFKERVMSPFLTLLMPAVQMLVDIELDGIEIDVAQLMKAGQNYKAKMYKILVQLGGLTSVKRYAKKAGIDVFNPRSPQQVLGVLEEFGCSARNTRDATLKELARGERDKGLRKFARLIPEYRSLATLRSTFVDGLLMRRDSENRVHTNFALHRTVTGRLASSDPNLQNVADEKPIRRSFVAAEGNMLVKGDYKAHELRVIAVYADEKVMKKAFADGLEIHRFNAARIYGVPYEDVTPEQRKQAKSAGGFGVLYGRGATGLANSFGWSWKRAQRFIDDYFRGFPDLKPWMARLIAGVKKRGYLRTYFGRKRRAAVIDEHLERSLINDPISSTASDLCLAAALELYDLSRDGSFAAWLRLLVHDEIVVECREEDAEEVGRTMRAVMEGADYPWLTVPLAAEISVGKNWGSLEEMKV